MDNDNIYLKNTKINFLPLHLVYIIYFSIRLSTGSINVIYLLGQGVILSNILFLTATFSLSSFLFSFYCTRSVRDNRGIIIISLFMFIIYCFGMSFAPNIVLLLIAQIAYGICLSGMSVAYFSWVSLIFAKNTTSFKELTYINNYFKHKTMRMATLATAFTSTTIPLSFLFFDISINYIFILNAIIAILLFIYFLQLKYATYIPNEVENQSDKLNIKDLIPIVKKDKLIIYAFIISMLLSIALTPIFGLWQPYFGEVLKIENNNLLYFLIAINFFIFVSQYIFNNIPKKLYESNFIITTIFASIAGIFLLLSSIFANYEYFSMFTFILFLGVLSAVFYSKDNYILSAHSDKSRGLISYSSLLEQAVSALYSIFMGFIIIYISVINIFMISGLIMCMISILAFICLKIQRKHKQM